MKYQLFGAPKRYLDASSSSSNKVASKQSNAASNAALEVVSGHGSGKGSTELPENWETLKFTVPVALTVYLSCYEDMVSREILAELFFPRETMTNARGNLRSNLNKLRTHKEYKWAAPCVTANTKSIGFTADSDVRQFEKAFEEKRYQEVIRLYQGQFLESISTVDSAPSFNEWIEDKRNEFENKNYIATRELANEWVQDGEVRKAIDLLHTLLHKNIEQKHATEICQQLLTIALDNGEINKGLNCFSDYKRALKVVAESLDDELYISPELELVAEQLTKAKSAIVIGVAGTAFPNTLTKTSHIPVQATKFIGRDNEIQDLLKQLLDFNTRMISLIGYGGIGKTRLSVQLAIALQDYFVDGVFVVELVATQSVDNIPSTINSVLGIKPQPGENPEDALNRVLRDKQLLLVLDNFEHLLDGRDFVDSLLGNNKNLDIIVTSREALNLTWEHIYEIEGLNFPRIKNPDLVFPKDLPEGQEIPKNILENETLPETVEEIAGFDDYDAVKLFLRSAKARVPDFSVATNKAAIQQICSFVEGLPLGIELAASWVASLSCEKIAETLEKDVAGIQTRLKDVPDRHKSLDIVFEHSWALLTEQEKNVLAKTAIFHGGFDNDAAETITSASLAELATLCDKSLLRVDDNRRYNLHEVIRQNAVRKLIEVPEVHTVTKAAHQSYYMDFIEECDYFELADNLENIEAAWLSTIEYYEPDTYSIDIGLFLQKIYISQGIPKRALSILDSSLNILDNRKDTKNFNLLKANLMRSKAFFLDQLGFPKEAQLYDDKVLKLAKELREPTLLTNAFHRLALSYEKSGRLNDAIALLEEALQKFTYSGHEALLLAAIARIQTKVGDFDNAKLNYQRSIVITEKLGKPEEIVHRKNNYSKLLFDSGKYEEAKTLVTETLLFAAENNIQRNRYVLSKKLAQIFLLEENYTEAWSTAQQALNQCNEQGVKSALPQIIAVLGDIALETRNIPLAKNQYTKAIGLTMKVYDADGKYSALIGLAKIHSLVNETPIAVTLLSSLKLQSDLRSSLKTSVSAQLEELKNALSETSYIKAFQNGNTEFMNQYCIKLLDDSSSSQN